jgi:hypothetical protein
MARAQVSISRNRADGLKEGGQTGREKTKHVAM